MAALITFFGIALAAGWYYFSDLVSELRREQHILRRMLRTLEARVTTIESTPPQPLASVITEPLTKTAFDATPETVSTAEAISKSEAVSKPEFASTPQRAADPWRSTTPAITYPDTYQEDTTPKTTPPWPINFVHAFFTSGNTLARVGVALLFIGAGLLIKLAADNGLLNMPIEWRLTAVGIGGMFLIGLGWRLRDKRAGYALSLQGGGIAMIYLTLFASLRLFHLLPTAITFTMLLILCLLSALLAVLQNTQALAIIATCGGFLAPIVTSTGDGNHVALFSYYVLLNFSILAMAWYRAWRALNLLGFAFTLIIGSVWGILKYDSSLWSSTQPFLIVFFLFYVTLSILFALRQPVNLRGYIDGTLVFGTPIIGFALQALLMTQFNDGLTYSAITLCVFYGLLAFSTFHFGPSSLRLLTESFLAIGSVFGTLAIPLALDNQGTVAAWALEGVALIYVGIRQNRRYAFYIGFLLQLAAAVFVLIEMASANHTLHWPIINSAYLSGLIMAIAGLLSGYLLQKIQPINYHPRNLRTITLIWSTGWWLLTHFYEIAAHSHSLTDDHPWQPGADCWLLLLGSASVVLAQLLGKKLQWPQLQKLAQYSLIFMGLAIINNLGNNLAIRHLFTAAAWMISFSCLYGLQRHPNPAASTPNNPLNRWQHGGAMWVGTLLISWQLCGWLQDFTLLANTWGFCSLLLTPSAALLLILSATRHIDWPFKTHANLYRGFVSTPIAASLIGLMLVSIFFQTGNSEPLSYLPLLNPLDISMACAFGCLLLWQQHLQQPPFALSISQEKMGLAALFFLWLNSALLRTLHHWYGLELNINAITHSNLAQTCLTVLWSSIAMLVMLTSSRRGQRSGWIAGAILLAVVVIKLFLLDLASVGSIMRIISFMFVGVLMLIIGYLRPIPPRPIPAQPTPVDPAPADPTPSSREIA